MADSLNRREFVRKFAEGTATVLLLSTCGPMRSTALAADKGGEYDPEGHLYGMGVQVDKCIGCGKCVGACKIENDVPKEPYFFRTWVERYLLDSDLHATVDSPKGGINSFPPPNEEEEEDILRSFFVPKLCNHCDKPPCVQVCPVGATFKTRDGVILVDADYCVGCRYCIQACPYGARYMHPETHTADKCTFCYHRITKGMLPACVEVCPTQARVFGELKSRTSPLRRMMRMTSLQVLKPELNTEPKVLYSRLDGEVR